MCQNPYVQFNLCNLIPYTENHACPLISLVRSSTTFCEINFNIVFVSDWPCLPAWMLDSDFRSTRTGWDCYGCNMYNLASSMQLDLQINICRTNCWPLYTLVVPKSSMSRASFWYLFWCHQFVQNHSLNMTSCPRYLTNIAHRLCPVFPPWVRSQYDSSEDLPS